MATAYVFEYQRRLRLDVKLRLPTDPIPPAICGSAARDGVFEARYDAGGRPVGPGTFIGVTGLPAGYDLVVLDAALSVGVGAIASPLVRVPGEGQGGACFAVTLLPKATRRQLTVTFKRSQYSAMPSLTASRQFDGLHVDTSAVPATPRDERECGGALTVRVQHLPRACLSALVEAHGEPSAALALAPSARGIAKLVGFRKTSDDGGDLSFTVEDTPDDQHVLALVASNPSDSRTITAVAEPFFFQSCPRLALRGPLAGKSLAANQPPARFKIGPFEGMAAGHAELVHAVYGDLRGSKAPYDGRPWTFQLRVQPLRAVSGDDNLRAPVVVDGELETAEGGDLGIVVSARDRHARMSYAVVSGGKLGERRPLLATGNPLVPADGTLTDAAVRIEAAGVSATLPLPDRAIVFFLDEFELTNARTGLLRRLDTAPGRIGTDLVMAVHALGPCGCVSRMVIAAPGAREATRP